MNSKGITLIETMIAVFILAIGIVAVLQAFPSGIRLVKSSQMTTVAVYLAQEKIEKELPKYYNELAVGVQTEDYNEIVNFSAYKRVSEVRCVEPVNLLTVDCNYDIINDPYPMKKIEVTVYWRSPLIVTENNINLISLATKK